MSKNRISCSPQGQKTIYKYFLFMNTVHGVIRNCTIRLEYFGFLLDTSHLKAEGEGRIAGLIRTTVYVKGLTHR
ncbi:hypothetical protein ACF0H5_005763 [Mactra antiquata]